MCVGSTNCFADQADDGEVDVVFEGGCKSYGDGEADCLDGSGFVCSGGACPTCLHCDYTQGSIDPDGLDSWGLTRCFLYEKNATDGAFN